VTLPKVTKRKRGGADSRIQLADASGYQKSFSQVGLPCVNSFDAVVAEPENDGKTMRYSVLDSLIGAIMSIPSRRRFLQNVGSGMLVAGLGSNLAVELGAASETCLIPPSVGNDYGGLSRWVGLMQELKPDPLQVKMVTELGKGAVTLKNLVAAAALANAETFGGQDYVGYHAEMALLPALEISDELSGPQKPLPVLKVLYRNSSRIQQYGPQKKMLKPLGEQKTQTVSVDRFGPELRQLVRQADMDQAEQLFATLHQNDSSLAFDTLLYTIADEVDVHRFVLAYRGLSLIDVAGAEHSHTLLRQCVRHCVDFEQRRKAKGRKASPIRGQIPKLLDQYKLVGKPLGNREPDDQWLEKFSNTLYNSTKFDASQAVAEAMADGVAPKSICQSIAMACNQLTLRQSGNPLRTHGASAGVHGSDAANAWRHMVSNSNDLNQKVGLLVSAWHTGRYDQWNTDAYPLENHFEQIKTEKADQLLGICEEAIRGNDQGNASASIHRYLEQGHDTEPVFELMRKYAISEDGRLHSEKFYRTVREEYLFARPAFRSRQLVALARVTASAYAYDVQDNHGHRAPGYEDACKLLNVKV
jgi:hypothetical protein